MSKIDKYLFHVEYRWGSQIIVFAPNKEEAIKEAKNELKDEWDGCHKIMSCPIKITGDTSWTYEQWTEERERLKKEQFPKKPQRKKITS